MFTFLDKKQDPMGAVIYLNNFTFVITRGLSFKTKETFKHDDRTSYYYLGIHLMVGKNKGKGFRVYLFI